MSTITSSSAVTDQEKDKSKNLKPKNSVTSILHRRNVDDSHNETRTKNKRKQNGVTFATKEDDHSSSIANNHKRRRNEDISTRIETSNTESNLDMTQDQVRQLKSIRRHQRQHNKNNNNGTDKQNNLLSDDENEEDKRNSSIHRLSDDQYDDDDDDEQKATRRNHHQRQNQQQNLFVGEDMVVDSRNLSSEENGDTIPIEPFNMENERTDGSGYFDGDTFVFRRNQKDEEEEEEDAWLENLDDNNKKNESNDEDKTRSTIHLWNSKNKQQAQPKRDKKSKIELYQMIDSKLAKDNETVLQAIQRFGSLVAKQKKKKQTEKAKQAKDESSPNGHKNNLARESLDILTECAQACLMEYDDHSIYQRSKSFFQNQLSTLVKPKKEMVMGEKNEQKKVIEWEYMGNADKEQIIQGPFTTQQMISWIQAGYFVGANAVQVRSITTTIYKEEKKKEESTTSKKEKLENMLQDLEDSDDDENDNDDTEHSNLTKVIRGGWLSSDKVPFSSYL